MKILHLHVLRHWFDLIALGHKKIDYRLMTVYWYERLWHDMNNAKVFDEVHIMNGYNHNLPFCRIEFKETRLVPANTKVTYPDGTILLPGSTYGIVMGDILELKNWPGPKNIKPKVYQLKRDILRQRK